jgi:hypothetical protein
MQIIALILTVWSSLALVLALVFGAGMRYADDLRKEQLEAWYRQGLT